MSEPVHTGQPKRSITTRPLTSKQWNGPWQILVCPTCGMQHEQNLRRPEDIRCFGVAGNHPGTKVEVVLVVREPQRSDITIHIDQPSYGGFGAPPPAAAAAAMVEETVLRRERERSRY